MEKYICGNVFVPLRAGPSHKSEMLSQILFGERYTISDTAGKWLKARLEFDGYEGWIDTDHLQHTIDNENNKGHVITRSLLCFKSDKTKLVLEPGSEIFNPDPNLKRFSISGNDYTTTPDFSSSHLEAAESLADTAMRFINSPYIWGGRIPSGIDCSGLTQLVFKIHGVTIPRDSFRQAETGETVSFISESKPGDLVFFENETGRISHVGMIISSGLVIHASGRVRIDTIDHQGIFKAETGRYSHHLRLIKRILL